MEPLLTTEEVADYLRVEVVTVRRLINRGDLAAYRIGGEFRFMAPDIEDFVKRQRVPNPGGEGEQREVFEKFTERARKVLAFAQLEAQSFQHDYIGTEHLLLGLIREGEGVAARVLMRLGVELVEVRIRILHIMEQGKQRNDVGQHLKAAVAGIIGSIGRGDNAEGEIGLTNRAKKVMELAVDEARRMKHHYIGTEHLLLGLLREGDGLAAYVLVEGFGLNLGKVRELTLQVLSEPRELVVLEVPAEAASLLKEGEEAIICSRCEARNPKYFRYCFNCGVRFP